MEVKGDDLSHVILGKSLMLLETETKDLPWAGPSDPQRVAPQRPGQVIRNNELT